jgi:hypothetical protein
LKTELESLVVTLNTDATEFDNDGATWTAVEDGWVTALTIEKINGVTSAQTIANTDGSALAADDELENLTFDLFKGVTLWADEELDAGTTAYYVVKATFSGLSSTVNKYFQIKLNDLDWGSAIEYSSNDTDDSDAQNANAADEATDDITELRIGTTSISGPSISSNY